MNSAGWVAFLRLGAITAALVAAGSWSVRTGLADFRMRQETVAATERAIALSPGQAEYYARLAWMLSETDRRKARSALERAVALNAWDARSWIELGIGAEADGDSVTSIRCLLRAAEVDHGFVPRWTLANYYFRHDDTPAFWIWAKEAVAMAYGDVQPLFRLCGRVEEDGKLIERLQIRGPAVRAGYLSYLLSQDRVDLIGPAVHRLLEDNLEADVPLLSAACDRLLDARRVEQAAELWNRQADAGRVPFRTPAGDGQQLLANNRFLAPPTSRGFDWRLPGVEGTSISREAESGGLRVTFSGRQPEDCEALVQLVPLGDPLRYDLKFLYRTQGVASGAGLEWRVSDPNGGAVLGEGSIQAAEAEVEGQLSFEASPACRLVRLALRYRRTPGTTRIDGFLVLREVALRPAPQSPMRGSRVRK